jgi:hypothetical protein
MKQNPSPRNQRDHLDKIVDELKAKQSNTVWPDPMINSRSVDEFLWKGSTDAPLVQRIGAWIFGLAFILVGVLFVEADRESSPDRKSLAAVIVGVAFFWIGVKVFLNGFRRRKKHAAKTD